MKQWTLIGLIYCIFQLSALGQSGLGDGLYAQFLTTQGEWICRLEFQRAPRTVANFVSLADGTKTFLDYRQGNISRRPFFNGLTFHRVIEDFVIQSGSPNGLGTDDAGYKFQDEFHPDLRHSKVGILSMANSGPNSNGSQFFITLTNTPWLDNLHTVFGEVVSGLDVVKVIGTVPVDAKDKPINPVSILSINILRQGAAALAFDATKPNPPLPEPAAKTVRADYTPSVPPKFFLRWEQKTNCAYRIFLTPNWNTWVYTSQFVNGAADFSTLISNPADPKYFFHLVEIQY